MTSVPLIPLMPTGFFNRDSFNPARLEGSPLHGFESYSSSDSRLDLINNLMGLAKESDNNTFETSAVNGLGDTQTVRVTYNPANSTYEFFSDILGAEDNFFGETSFRIYDNNKDGVFNAGDQGQNQLGLRAYQSSEPSSLQDGQSLFKVAETYNHILWNADNSSVNH